MAKRISNGGSPVGGRTQVSRATFLKAGRELQAMGFRIQESKGFPPLDMNAHSQNSDHYAFGGYGAFDGNAVAGGVNNTRLERCLIDTVMVPHLVKRGFKAVIWWPRKGIVGGHTTWCHAGRSTWGDYRRLGGWSKADLKARDAWLRKHGSSKVAIVSKSRGPQQNLSLGSDALNKKFQKVVGTKADGDIGPNTIGALQRVFIEGADKRSNISTTAWKIGKKHGVVLDYSASAPVSSIVKGIQEYMNVVLGKKLKVDGKFGPSTRKEFAAYIKAGGSLGHGAVAKKAQVKSKVLQYGDKGNDVKTLQKALKISVDGSYGPKTKKAVQSFQKSKGLSVDGMAGPKTQAALGI